VLFALGGRVAGGLYGAPPDLTSAATAIRGMDFRGVCATVLDRW
jgi:hypothetical protein